MTKTLLALALVVLTGCESWFAQEQVMTVRVDSEVLMAATESALARLEASSGLRLDLVGENEEAMIVIRAVATETVLCFGEVKGACTRWVEFGATPQDLTNHMGLSNSGPVSRLSFIDVATSWLDKPQLDTVLLHELIAHVYSSEHSDDGEGVRGGEGISEDQGITASDLEALCDKAPCSAFVPES